MWRRCRGRDVARSATCASATAEVRAHNQQAARSGRAHIEESVGHSATHDASVANSVSAAKHERGEAGGQHEFCMHRT